MSDLMHNEVWLMGECFPTVLTLIELLAYVRVCGMQWRKVCLHFHIIRFSSVGTCWHQAKWDFLKKALQSCGSWPSRHLWCTELGLKSPAFLTLLQIPSCVNSPIYSEAWHGVNSFLSFFTFTGFFLCVFLEESWLQTEYFATMCKFIYFSIVRFLVVNGAYL